VVTNSEINTTNPIGIVSGGTNAASMATTNGTVYYDGSKLATTSTGSAGQALTSNGGVSSPSYQALTSGGGAWVLIQSQTASASAFLDFVVDNTYSNFAFIFDGILPDTATQTFGMTWSTDGGMTYLASYKSGYYVYGIAAGIPSLTQSASATNTYNYIGAPTMTTSGIPLSGTAYLTSITQGAATFYPSYYCDAVQVISGDLSWVTGFGRLAADTQAITNISFQFTSGNIASGTISFFGITT
jgi:hypothetical protein